MNTKAGFKKVNGKWLHYCEGRYHAARENREWQQLLVLTCPRCGAERRAKRP